MECAFDNALKNVSPFCVKPQVGREMSTSTDDRILQQDMPQALRRVEEAAKLLEEAAKLSKIDPFSKVSTNARFSHKRAARQLAIQIQIM